MRGTTCRLKAQGKLGMPHPRVLLPVCFHIMKCVGFGSLKAPQNPRLKVERALDCAEGLAGRAFHMPKFISQEETKRIEAECTRTYYSQ